MELSRDSRDRSRQEYTRTEGEDLPQVTEEDIAHIVASWTGVPVNKLTESESEKLLHMEDTCINASLVKKKQSEFQSNSPREGRLKNPEPTDCQLLFLDRQGRENRVSEVLAAYFSAQKKP